MTLDQSSKLESLRHALPATTRHAYLNAGTYGPLSAAAEQAAREWLGEELEYGRIAPERFRRGADAKSRARAALARLIGAQPAEIALTRHTTEGMNVAVLGRRWQAGDEIVTTDVEHGGGLLPVRLAEKRYGLTVRVAQVGLRGGDVTAAIAEQLTPRTRLVVLSHVSYATGARYDLPPIAELSHRHGVEVAVDGAQSVGAIPVDVAALGVDYYAFSGQKWLLGPSGTGGLYVRSERLESLDPLLIGTGAVSSHEDLDHYVLWPDGRRFEGATTTNLAAIAGLTASVIWRIDEVGLDWSFDRSRTLVRRAAEGLRALDGVEVITPDDRAGLVCFRVRGQKPAEVVEALAREGILTRSIAETAAVRFAIGFYNTEAEIDHAIGIVSSLIRS
ncbi:MAG: aminotransferase class V-fold PLP-dependent enzyme [Anaerolineae bacterium]